ncbi:hypothetical protein ME763_24400 [Streptomyces murinus]|uniref:hypothetical protein n=1 Tax=Streptomyces murinus TaxID=33900 RepID=UPI00117C8C06|nr:hypothetical protein [Streptomyces murinus]WDO08521.1 hypothetical protein ME763_24400 [Streptomyces murinus]
MTPATFFVFILCGRLVMGTAAMAFPEYARYRQLSKTAQDAAGWSWPGMINFFGPLLALVLTSLLVRRAAVLTGWLFDVKAGSFMCLNTWAELIHRCAEVVRAPRIRDEHYTSSVSNSVGRIYRARSMRGTVGVSSWRRRRVMREHAFRVADAMRAAEAQLDVDPKEAARRIAALTLKISNRYVEGRVGALLDQSDLDDVPVIEKRFEAAKLAISALCIAGVALGAQALGLPIQVSVMTSVVVVAAVFRNATITGLGALAFLYPFLFPAK